MDFQNDQPIYIQIGTFIKEQIINGTIQPGEKLPSVREYAVFFEVSPLTIHRTIQYLEAEGIVGTRKGIGSFVRTDIQKKLSKDMVTGLIQDFIGRMRNCGLTDAQIKTAVLQELEGGLK